MVRVESLVAMLLVTFCAPTLADETGAVAWHTSVEAAWSATRQHRRPLLLFVTCDDCAFCTRMKNATYGNPAIAAEINRSYVPLVLDGRGDSPLVRELNVKSYPCTFVISPQSVVLARIDGYISPRDLARQLGQLHPTSGIAVRAPGR